jgi:hypothetical protein
MFIDENQEVDLEISTEEAEEDTYEEPEQGVEYWKAEALKNKAILERNKNKEPKEPKQSDGFDYGSYAFMEQRGITSDEDITFVKNNMKETGKSLRDLLNTKWFQTELAERKEVEKTADSAPKGKRTGNSATDSVDYWLGKDLSEAPKHLHREIVNAKLKKEGSGSHFYNS